MDPVNIQLTEATLACSKGRFSICLQVAAKTFELIRTNAVKHPDVPPAGSHAPSYLETSRCPEYEDNTRGSYVVCVCVCVCVCVNFFRTHIDVMLKQ